LENELYKVQARLWLALVNANMHLRLSWPDVWSVLKTGLNSTRSLGDVYYTVYHLLELGRAATHMGQIGDAEAHLRSALEEATFITDLEEQAFMQATIQVVFAELMLLKGNYDQVLHYAALALDIASRDSNLFLAAAAEMALARLYKSQGDVKAALHFSWYVLDAALRYEWRDLEQQAQLLRADSLMQSGWPAKAQTAAVHALHWARELKDVEGEILALLSLGRALQALGNVEEATATLDRALALGKSSGYLHLFQGAETLHNKRDNE
jgi:ATP/maltotriose-dependent transcriptional regulator MalT